MRLMTNKREKLRFLFIEPFYGGSHKLFARGLIKHSKHDIDLVTLPERNWSWRMRGAALHFARSLKGLSGYDGIIVTDLMNLADFKAITNETLPPILVYFHENQLTYPLAPGNKRDYALCLADMTTALSADRVLFNSAFHRSAFLKALAVMVDRAPDYPVPWVVDEIKSKSSYIYPGCEFEENRAASPTGNPPLIAWNHRWAFDKNGKDFFKALEIISSKNIDFRLVLLGQSEPRIPEAFELGLERFKDQIEFAGYAETRESYLEWLKRSDIVVSTAKQENFGIAVVEAIYYGCFPLLPDRLSYPEIIPEKYKKHCIYKSNKNLVTRLTALLQDKTGFNNKIKGLDEHMAFYSWHSIIPQYDTELEKLVRQEQNAQKFKRA